MRGAFRKEVFFEFPYFTPAFAFSIGDVRVFSEIEDGVVGKSFFSACMR